jgi:hypothetical protein
MTLLYKILTVIINTVAMLLAISLVLSIPMMLSSPLTMLSGFMMVAIILYAWFSNQFSKKVLQQQQVVKKNLKDLVKVNGIVALIFSIVVIVDVIILMGKPQAYVDAIKGYGVDMPLQTITTFLYIMLVYGIVLLVHVIWTFILLRKHSSFFQ